MMRRDKGAALIIAMVAIIAIAGMATALLNMASVRSRGTNDRLQEFQAFQAAQAAVDRAMVRMSTGGPEAGPFGSQFLSNSRVGNLDSVDATGDTSTVVDLAGVEYFAAVGDVGDGTYAIVGAASLGDSERVLEVIVKPPASTNLPGPFPPSGAESFGAMGMFGDAKNASIHLPSTTNGGTVSGYDLAGANDCLGVALGHQSVYEDVMGGLSAGDAGVFVGSTTSTYGDVTTSIDVASGATVDSAKIQEYADAISTTASTLVATNTIIPPSGSDPLVYDSLTGVTRIDEAVTLKPGDTIEGTGTLIITDKFKVQGGTLDWDGDVIILGGNGGNELNVTSGSVTIEPQTVTLPDGSTTESGGSLITISDGNGPAGIDLNGGTTTIEGAILIASTAGSGSNKSTFLVNKGTNTLGGLLMATGDKVHVKIMPNPAQGSFAMEGGIILAVPETESTGPDKMTAWIKGNSTIQFHSTKVNNALNTIKGIFDEFAPNVPPPAASGMPVIVVWREK